MRELLELQTGQVSFLSGILAGFAMTAALHIMRHGLRSRTAQFVFLVSTLSSLLFIVALYIDVRLTLELAGRTNISEPLMERISAIRVIGTTSATAALFLFVVATAMLGWLSPRRTTGIITTIVGICITAVLVYAWFQIGSISAELGPR
jgi:uncharacterized BrkB/YihY/UPF0761 family membrane protein